MIYVIEGMDGTGKTTLAHELSHVLAAPVLKTGWIDSHNDYIDDIIVARTIGACKPERHIILDRSIFSGISYGNVGAMRAQAIFRDWLCALDGVPVTVVHLVASEETRLARDRRGTKSTLDCTLDTDIPALIKAATEDGSWPIQYMVFDTTVLMPGHILDVLSRRRLGAE